MLFNDNGSQEFSLLSSLTQALTGHSSIGTSLSADRVVTGIDMSSLRAALEKVPDPRFKRGVRYPFTELLLMIVCAVFSGAKTLTMTTEWAHDAGRAAPLFPAGVVPSLAIINPVAARVDPAVLDTAVNMAALDHGTGTVVGQGSIGEKTNETHLPQVVNAGPRSGCRCPARTISSRTSTGWGSR